TTTRRLGLAPIRASKSWSPANTVASTMLKGGFSNRTLQYADVSSMTRTCAADSVMIRAPCFDQNRARRRVDVFLFIGTHARECGFADAQFQEEISFECQSLGERRLGGVADETLDVSNRFRCIERQVLCNLHRAIESLAADGFVHQPLLFGFTWSERNTHE